jgi:hypothetical protein
MISAKKFLNTFLAILALTAINISAGAEQRAYAQDGDPAPIVRIHLQMAHYEALQAESAANRARVSYDRWARDGAVREAYQHAFAARQYAERALQVAYGAPQDIRELAKLARYEARRASDLAKKAAADAAALRADEDSRRG